MGLFLAMYGNDVSLDQALFISVFAMAVVFIVLLIISYLIDISAFFINGSSKTKKSNGASTKAASVAPVSNVKSSNASDSYIVAIAAAIAAYLGTSVDNIRIKKIRRINQSNSAWTERGLLSQIERLS